MTPDPREDALALLAEVSRGLKQCRSCIHVSSQLRERIRAAISAPPSQSGVAEDMREAAAMVVHDLDLDDTPRDKWEFGMCFGEIAERRIRALPLTPSPTPYVRPAAEIRAEIEREQRTTWAQTLSGRSYIRGLTFALTPPTQENETP